ncbi:histamine H3 receptor isoform X1 [Dunckerocampus dactyliophorus]|uniref:histamine H3 receptor isoform X1 n=1 Tax=Dunckerocampus dactyliophorus TaxID=161453 RepID=UPI0024060FEE|nr:histamine H3 receptor isoform X1 [Dunckerocampus dactyliophorus]
MEEHTEANSSGHHFDDGPARIQSSFVFSRPVFAILMVMMVTLVVVTVLGNALVMFAFKMDKSLRRQCNYYFLNLAISDFLVGAFCIPVYIPYILTGRWTLGRGLCKLWLVMDYLLCSASVFSIVLISYDRFLSVTRAVSYRARQGMSHLAIIKMIAVWALAFVLYGPAIIFWELVAGQSRVPEDECFAEFYHSWYFLLCASMLEFFSPFISVAFFNLSIYLNIRQRRLRCREAQLNLQLAEPMSTQGEGIPLSHTWGLGGKLGMRGSVHSPASSPNLGKMDLSSSRVAQPNRLSRDKKIAKSLAIIVCVFAICWAPYTLLMIIRAACRGQCIPHHWYEVTFWLLWLNSAINPFLYPLCHSSFRRAFARILCPKQRRTTSPPLSVLRAGQ